MTHSLHRLGPKSLLTDDYVWLVYHTRGVNDVDLERKYREILDLAKELGSVNYGNIKVGNIFTTTHENLKRSVTEKARIRGVFTSKQQVVEFLREMKRRDYGLSVIISGLIEEVLDAASQAGVKPHSINLSLGVWGRKELLPPEDILTITTMCGHHMISPRLVERMVERIRSGEITPEKAAEEMAKLCPCGIFNQIKASRILRIIAEQKY